MYDVTNTALPRTGLRGVEKTAEKTAWTKSTAESGFTWSRTQRDDYGSIPQCCKRARHDAQLRCLQDVKSTHNKSVKDTGNSKGLSKGVKGRAPRDLPGGDVGQHKAQLVQQVPHLEVRRTKKKSWAAIITQKPSWKINEQLNMGRKSSVFAAFRWLKLFTAPQRTAADSKINTQKNIFFQKANTLIWPVARFFLFHF